MIKLQHFLFNRENQTKFLSSSYKVQINNNKNIAQKIELEFFKKIDKPLMDFLDR